MLNAKTPATIGSVAARTVHAAVEMTPGPPLADQEDGYTRDKLFDDNRAARGMFQQ